MRLFFALESPPVLKESLAAFQVQHSPMRGAWIDPQKLHLTLAFLGEVPDERLESLLNLGWGVAKGRGEIPLTTSILGGFPRIQQARVLWLGLETNSALEALVMELRGALASQGIPLDPKPFTAHLTLARFRVPADLRGLAPAPAPVSFKASELVLMRSHLEPTGTRHERLGVFPLRG